MTTRNTHAEETQLADAYLDTATLGREVAAHALAQALKDAKAGTLRDPAKTAVSAITASAIALDKRLILQERPTHIVSVDPSAALNALARRVGVKYDADAIPDAEIAETPPQPLLSEGEPGKRASASN